jgi:hypothetical protein
MYPQPYLAVSFRSNILSFLISSTSNWVLEVPDKRLKNLVGDIFLAAAGLSLEYLVELRSTVDPEAGRWTWLRENIPGASTEKPRL